MRSGGLRLAVTSSVAASLIRKTGPGFRRQHESGCRLPGHEAGNERLGVIRRTPAVALAPPEWLGADPLDETYFRLLPTG